MGVMTTTQEELRMEMDADEFAEFLEAEESRRELVAESMD